jgi:hypothetical protein
MPRPPVAPAAKSGAEQPIFEAPKSSPRAEKPAAPLGAPEKAHTPAAAEKPTAAASATQKEEELVAFLTASLISLNRESTVPDEPVEAAPISALAAVEPAPPSSVAAEPAVPKVAPPPSRPPSSRRSLGWIGGAAAVVLLGGIGVAVGVMSSGRSKPHPPTQAALAAAAEEPRREPPKSVAPPAEKPTPPEKPRETAAPSEPNPAEPASAAAPATDESGVTKVTLTVTPTEAKAARPGRLPEKTPVTYEIPKGSRIMVNVSCYGYQSKELVLDGSKTEISLNLQRKAGGAPEPAK